MDDKIRAFLLLLMLFAFSIALAKTGDELRECRAGKHASYLHEDRGGR